MKLTLDHELHIRNVQTARQARDEAKITARLRAQAMIDAEISAHQHEVDRAVRVAVEAGVPKRQVGILGLGTSDYKTLQAALSRTEGLAAAVIAHEETDPLAQRYSLNGAVLTVTLTPDELTEAKRAVNYEADTAPATAEFTIEHTARGPRLKALSPETLDNYERNPAVYWTYEREVEALAWYAEHSESEGEVAA